MKSAVELALEDVLAVVGHTGDCECCWIRVDCPDRFKLVYKAERSLGKLPNGSIYATVLRGLTFNKNYQDSITRNRKPGSLRPFPTYGDLFTIEEFVENVKAGALIDYDGHGNYAMKDGMSDLMVKPSDIKEGVNEHFTHVMWFNR